MGLLKKHPSVLVGLAVTLVFLALWLVRFSLFTALDLKLYDLMMGLRTDPESDAAIVMVDIDDDSIEKLGRWPWPRSRIASGIDKIQAGNPRAIGLNLILSEPEHSEGLNLLTELEKQFAKLEANTKDAAHAQFAKELEQAKDKLDNDQKLAQAIKASGKVMLPVYFKEGLVAADQVATDEALIRQSIGQVKTSPDAHCPKASEILVPILPFFENALGIGHINLGPDMDGVVRRERLIYEYRGIYIPSLSLRLAGYYLNIPVDRIRADLGEAIHLGQVRVPITQASEMMVSFKGPSGAFRHYSFFDVINDKVSPSVFLDKIVLINPMAAGILNPLSTPVDKTMHVGEFSANVVWTLLNGAFVYEPTWAQQAELGLLIVFGLVVSFVLGRQKAMVSALIFILMSLGLVGASTYLLVDSGVWLKISYPLLLLLIGYTGVVTVKYFVTETGKKKVEGESAESNRQLGLTYQSQGMLDMAFDKFRKIPMDDDLKSSLYNLALDYERKRQLNKAALVLEHIEGHDSSFRDVKARKKKLMEVSETMVFGENPFAASSSSDNLLATGTGTRPTLGRYEVIRALGKGAMGIVYLGEDPRIRRTCAIKTIRFDEDFSQEEQKEARERFFREAESAGTLSHPNIVTIYDAGEEQELAYIAMEYLEGKDLEAYTKTNNLLPWRKVMDYTADIADALDYAHKKGIVHRDIKPANVMLLDSGVIKITDFGIARITATSKTQTGVVKGSPYYMSPEQFRGEKVDGRSDIFSLGTMMFQLLTGFLPFQGESPAALMHRIMNEPHPDPKIYNSGIPKYIKPIVDKALAKDREGRYQTAGQMAEDLRSLAAKLDAAMEKKRSGTKS